MSKVGGDNSCSFKNRFTSLAEINCEIQDTSIHVGHGVNIYAEK